MPKLLNQQTIIHPTIKSEVLALSKLDRSQLHRSLPFAIAQRPAARAARAARPLRRQRQLGVAPQRRHRGAGAVHESGANEAGVRDEDVDATSCLGNKWWKWASNQKWMGF